MSDEKNPRNLLERVKEDASRKGGGRRRSLPKILIASLIVLLLGGGAAAYFLRGSGLLNKLGQYLLPPYTRQVIWQDVVIMANQGKSLRNYGSEFLNSEADLLHRYIESLRSWAESGGRAPRPQPTKEDIVFYV